MLDDRNTIERELLSRATMHLGALIDLVRVGDWDNLLVRALSFEACIAALRHWVMYDRLGMDFSDTDLN